MAYQDSQYFMIPAAEILIHSYSSFMPTKFVMNRKEREFFPSLSLYHSFTSADVPRLSMSQLSSIQRDTFPQII